MNDSSNSANFNARQLRFWLATLSPGDLSVNEGAAARPGSVMITGVGSPNDALWSQMEGAGWANRITVDDPSMANVASTFAFTEAGARAVTKALAELVSWNAQIMALFNGFDSSEHVQQLCGVFSRLTLRTAAQLAIAQKSTPATEDGLARQRDCILALDEISKGVRMAGQYIIEALALGPDIDVGRVRLERSAAALHYAEQCLTERATEVLAVQSGRSLPPS
ncbi:hypothetical protein JQ616_08525 [Bradyrhizobium tropiciagri]|uniref:hypothetical protein n=1 Tax=Bradyrhizobium TaxID=374 RepID=UPI000A794439|nr:MULTISPECIES: hypothetical protein [Bradyrhizobium]MBR0894989.1 hypothetical protein [Bradyrhizobium tropiciagri]